MQRSLLTTTVLVATACATALAPAISFANPQGGVVVGGAATITESGTKLDVHQHTQRAVIDWRSFDIEVGEHTQFHQPSAGAVALNRVKSADPSNIAGKLSANGNIILINPNGVFFSGSAQVDVNGLVATTADITNERFMAGDNRFDITGNPGAGIVNEGVITAKEAGLVGLVAPHVINSGVIQAKLGRVQLASADTVNVDFYGDGLLHVEVQDEAVASQLVANMGAISANGGTVAMTAAAARNTIDSLIIADGVLEAKSIGKNARGAIVIGGEGSNKTAKPGASKVLVSGFLNASGRSEGQQGGSIEVLGDEIAITQSALLDASGHSAATPDAHADGTATMRADKTIDNGVRSEDAFFAHANRAGGSIKIGGDYLGKGDTQTAKTLYVEAGARFFNDAIDSGDAGRTIFWSDDTTEFYGTVFARGGIEGGNGGFLETSGKENLITEGWAELTNRHDGFVKGTYLLDPANITIYGNVDPSYVSTDGSVDLASDLKLWLDANDSSTVELTYSTDAMGGATATGTSGANTITLTVDVSSDLQPGARIRLGSAGAVATADTQGADTYTISSISGTTITLEENLTRNYTGETVYRGLVSQWFDKSGEGNDTRQLSVADRPLWVDDGINGNDVIYFDGADRLFQLNADIVSNQISVFSTVKATSGRDQSFYSLGLHRSNNGSSGYVLRTHRGNNSRIWWVVSDDSTAIDDGTPSILGMDYTTWTVHHASVDDVGYNYYFNNKQGVDDTFTNISFPIDYNDRVHAIGMSSEVRSYGLRGPMSTLTLYDRDLDGAERALMDQYESAKHDIALRPAGSGATEAAQAMASTEKGDTTDGFNAFTTRYLERLSSAADIVLAADSSITLDLQGDTLATDAGRSISLSVINGNITDLSAGTVRTDNGNITLNAGGAGSINLDTTNLEATNGGVVNLNAGGAVALTQASDLNLGTVNAGSINITSSAGGLTGNGAMNVTTGNATLQAANNITLLDGIDAGAQTIDLTATSGTIAHSAGTLSAGSINLDAGTTIAANLDADTAIDIGNNATSATLTGTLGGQAANQARANQITGGPGDDANYSFGGFTIRLTPPPAASGSEILPAAVQRELFVQPERFTETTNLTSLTNKVGPATANGSGGLVIEVVDTNAQGGDSGDNGGDEQSNESEAAPSNIIKLKVEKELAEEFEISNFKQ
jgi:filamentous hemagglutinin family protein